MINFRPLAIIITIIIIIVFIAVIVTTATTIFTGDLNFVIYGHDLFSIVIVYHLSICNFYALKSFNYYFCYTFNNGKTISACRILKYYRYNIVLALTGLNVFLKVKFYKKLGLSHIYCIV